MHRSGVGQVEVRRLESRKRSCRRASRRVRRVGGGGAGRAPRTAPSSSRVGAVGAQRGLRGPARGPLEGSHSVRPERLRAIARRVEDAALTRGSSAGALRCGRRSHRSCSRHLASPPWCVPAGEDLARVLAEARRRALRPRGARQPERRGELADRPRSTPAARASREDPRSRASGEASASSELEHRLEAAIVFTRKACHCARVR